MRQLCVVVLAVGIIGMGVARAALPPGAPNTSARFTHDQAINLAARLQADWARRAASGETPAVVTEPSIASGSVLTPSIDVTKAPGVPALQITLRSGTIGALYISTSLTSPSGQHVVSSSTFLPTYPPARTRTVGFQVNSPFANGGFGLYAEAGIWTLSDVTLISNDGQFVTYDGAQLAALFPNLTIQVANPGTPDATPPKAGRGRILTPTVSMGAASPIFAARLAVADAVSGVVTVSLALSGPGGSTLGASSNITLPIASGHAIAYATLPPGTSAGTYTITSVSVCDVAENCLSKMAPADIEGIFGSDTFQVTD